MKRFLLFLLALSLAAGLIACAPGDTAEPPAEETTAPSATAPETGENTDRAPDFTVLDGEGNPVKLSDFYGKPIVLNFWASWCPPCKAELSDFEEASKKYAGKVTFLMVNLTDGQRETVAIAKSFVESAGYTFPVYYDTAYEASMTFGIRSIPQTFFIDAAGTPVASATGMISASQLEEGIGMIFSE
jgi:thiol-disulfide isomerase/thioredoxin